MRGENEDGGTAALFSRLLRLCYC